MQSLLIPDPQPLVERLGREFFLQLPQGPGIYLMQDESSQVLYVGKAKNLRKRLSSYRVANPDRLPRRLLRLLHAVRNIECKECETEAAALAREAEMLRTLKPKFNRAGVWQGPTRYLAWRVTKDALQFAILPEPEEGWNHYGPCGIRAFSLRMAVLRLIWFATHSSDALHKMPHGWFHSDSSNRIMGCGNCFKITFLKEVSVALHSLFGPNPDYFFEWVQSQIPVSVHPFERAVIEKDIETLTDLTSRRKSKKSDKAAIQTNGHAKFESRNPKS